MAIYTLCISDGMSRNAGGEATVTGRNLADARQRWIDWASEGDYGLDTDGQHCEVSGSIWRGGEKVADMSIVIVFDAKAVS